MSSPNQPTHFEIEPDPDNEDFWSVFAYLPGGSGAELAGKIGSRYVAGILVNALKATSFDLLIPHD